MNKILKIILWITILWLQSVPITTVNAAWNYENSMNLAIEEIDSKLDTAEPNDPEWWWNTVVNFIFKMISNIVIPIAIWIWILIWVLWAYKLLFSGDEKQISAWLKMVVFWVIWIIIMVSAKYIWSVLFEDIFEAWGTTWKTWIQLSKILYNEIAYPFIKIALYLALAVIFVILVWKSISLITKSDWTSHKKALWIIWRCAVSILVIIGAKNIVEAIYWKQETIFDNETPQNLWNIGSWILADKNIPIVYNIITRALSIISLVIFILLLIQWFKILTNPNKSENFQKLWKNLLYTIIWLFVIGIWYLITNAFILN